MSRPRIEVRKTYELWVGGRFDRSESGRRDRVNDRAGRHAGNFPRASRKDVRDAVEAARAGFDEWAGRTAYSQVLYRFAETLEARAGELALASAALRGIDTAQARAETAAAVDRLVH